MCEMQENCTAIEDIKAIKNSISEIQTALLGNKYKPLGMIHEVAELKTKVKNIEERLSMVKWVAVGFGLAGTGAGAMLMKLIMMI